VGKWDAPKISSRSDPLLFAITAKQNEKRFLRKTRLKFRETFDCFDDYISLLKTSSRIMIFLELLQHVAVQQSFFFIQLLVF